MGVPFQASDTGVLTGSIPASQTYAPLQRPDGTPLPAKPNATYVMLQLAVMVSAGTTIQFFSVGSNQALTPPIACVAGTPFVLPYSPYGWFSGKLGETFGMTTSSGGTTDIMATYGVFVSG